METAKLKKFAQFARRSLLEQVSAKLKLVLAENSAARRERAEAVKKLEEAIKNHGKEQVIERVAYIWFNRFCALRFMDVNRYTRIGVVSPAEGQFQPEILSEAKMGHIDEEMVHDKVRQQIFALLDGKAPSRDPQGEAYRLLVVAACNFWNKAMPFLFQRIADYTELLMPDDLLSGNSILAYTREAMTPNACEDVEVIGWLYQFYISEKKDAVFEGLKKNQKITPENIPAATQLFTPHWIVRYLVENSLGRLWLLNRPGSKLIEQMDYYIKPEEECVHEKHERHEKENNEIVRDFRAVRGQEDFLRISSPEEIKICDPACGSGHMLTYAFDLLYAIYEEEGYDPAEIPAKILTHNLYGIELDERAGELAAFALTMKARAKQRRFFNKGVKPNICVLENVRFDEGEVEEYMDFVGRDLFTAPLQTTLRQFEEADNFGSLIRPDVTDVDGMLKILESKNVSGHLFLSLTHQKVLQALRQADYLSPKYHVVIANPPYMGSRNMSGSMASWLKQNYGDFKSDFFSAFIVRNTELALPMGQLGFMTPFTWMFISTYEQLRVKLLNEKHISSLIQLEYSGFEGATVPICTFTVTNRPSMASGFYVDLTSFVGPQKQQPNALYAIQHPSCGWAYQATSDELLKIPSAPIAYWASHQIRKIFAESMALGDKYQPRQGMATSDNNRFLRCWFEVTANNIGYGYENAQEANSSRKRWFPYNKGGDFRKWYGNNTFVIDWLNDGKAVLAYAKELYGSPTRTIKNIQFYFVPCVTWTYISSSFFGVRYSPPGFLFDVAGSSVFAPISKLMLLTGYMTSSVANVFLQVINPTLNFQAGNIAALPWNEGLVEKYATRIDATVRISVEITQHDWDSYETSWDFSSLPLLRPDYRQPTLKATYQKLRAHWRETTLEMQRLEKENNCIFIEAYGLEDELTPEVPLSEITLTCNPYYRYGKESTNDTKATKENQVKTVSDFRGFRGHKEFPIDEELEARLLADTMRELVSYAVGCMFGRYALDKPGLILANQGETLSDYYKKLSTNDTKGTNEEKTETFSDFREFRGQVSFPADEDNVIPMLDGDWFTDDIAERFRKFLRVAFGEEHYEENLRFVEQALNIKGKRNYSIRDYFLGEFYTDHVKRYKKRPIYWLFSSPKGSFNALIYMHRYRPDTVSVVLNDYLREFRTKLTSHKNHLEAVSISGSASQSEKTKALKEIERINKMIAELEEYEREVLYPLATEQVEINLDDGVKVNYARFGMALKKIPGLDAVED